MSGGSDPLPTNGFVDASLQAEFPGLRLSSMVLDAGPRSSPPAVKQRLRLLSDRYLGSNAVTMRTKPVPHAYRSFFRQTGLDPDVSRVPSEEVAVARLLHGGFRSSDLVSDALLIALVETGVPVWALDAGRVHGEVLGIRTSVEGERLGSGEHRLAAGRLVVADGRLIHALLFGLLAPGHGVGRRTDRVMLYAVGVEGVPEIHIEEALWLCCEVLGTD